MSWREHVGEPGSPSEPPPGSAKTRAKKKRPVAAKQANERVDEGSKAKIVESENDFPFAATTFMRIGSAHAVEHIADRETLVTLFQNVVNDINGSFGQLAAHNQVCIEERPS